jgi:hypothetical protein
MQTLNEILTANWVLRLPADWVGRQDPAVGFRFESGDGTKELYIATHIVGPDHAGSLEELAAWFVGVDLSTLAQMEGYAWVTVEKRIEVASAACVALIDSVAQAQHYRIVGKILSRPGKVVRASFHDYQYRDHAGSNATFAPILESLRLVAPPEGAGPVLH